MLLILEEEAIIPLVHFNESSDDCVVLLELIQLMYSYWSSKIVEVGEKKHKLVCRNSVY